MSTYKEILDKAKSQAISSIFKGNLEWAIEQSVKAAWLGGVMYERAIQERKQKQNA